MRVKASVRGDDVFRALQALGGDGFNRIMSDALMLVGKEVQAEIARYPGPAHKPVIWASEKQRRWWFASRRAAGLPPNYTRMSDPWSQDLLHKWEVERRGNKQVVVGTIVKYARWVQAAEQQTAQHRATGWVTDKEALEAVAESGVVGRIFSDALDKALP